MLILQQFGVMKSDSRFFSAKSIGTLLAINMGTCIMPTVSWTACLFGACRMFSLVARTILAIKQVGKGFFNERKQGPS